MIAALAARVAPLAYLASQKLAPEVGEYLDRQLAAAGVIPASSDRVLDVGAGPRSLLAGMGGSHIAVDLDPRFARRLRETSRSTGVTVANAAALPFATGAFDVVFSGGLLHHLSDPVAAMAVAEMLRVTAAGGVTAIFDGVLPQRARAHPLAWAVRRLDRGRAMRAEGALCGLLPTPSSWRVSRFTYAAIGLEGVLLVRRRSEE